MERDWELLALTDHYHTAVAIRDALREEDVQDATQGLEELIDALSRSEERALESRLIRFIQHIIPTASLHHRTDSITHFRMAI